MFHKYILIDLKFFYKEIYFNINIYLIIIKILDPKILSFERTIVCFLSLAFFSSIFKFFFEKKCKMEI